MTTISAIHVKAKKILIIASSGGGGLIQAANAKEQEFTEKNPHVSIIRRDVLKDWVGSLGGFSTKAWNVAQKKGNVWALRFFCYAMSITEFLFFPMVFFHLLWTLFNEDVDHIIDTQPLCTSAIIKALRFFNKRTGKEVILEKICVDLPTSKATHFLRPIKNLSKVDRSYIRLTTIPPLLENGETEKEFWIRHCRLPEAQINYEPFFVRQSFYKLHKKPRLPSVCTIRANIKNSEEKSLIQACLSKGCIEHNVEENEATFHIGPTDRVFTILLGSQPAFEGSVNYVKKFVQALRENNRSLKAHLFIFCGTHERGERSLIQAISQWVQSNPPLPGGSIIPLTFQNDEVIAPLFHRSDATCTRSGGQTLMELMCVSQGEIWIHSEAKKKGELSDQELLSGIAAWESANAVYMQKFYQAKLVTPETVLASFKRLAT